LKRKIRANKGKNSHIQFSYQQDWAFISESSVRSAKPETLNHPALENGEIRFLKKNKEDRGDWLLHGTAGKQSLWEEDSC